MENLCSTRVLFLSLNLCKLCSLLFMLLFVRVFGRRMDSEYEDMLLFEEKDKSCCVDITSTKDCQFITINSNSRTSSEARYSSILSFFYLWFLVIMYKLWLLLCFFGFLKVVIRKCMPVQVYLMDSADMRSGLQRIREREAGVQYFCGASLWFLLHSNQCPFGKWKNGCSQLSVG